MFWCLIEWRCQVSYSSLPYAQSHSVFPLISEIREYRLPPPSLWKIRLVFDVQDRISIQNGLDKLEKYSEVNKLKLIRLCIWEKKNQNSTYKM